MSSSDEVKMTYSSVLTKDGKPMVCVRFEQGKSWAEGVIPQCEITKSEGFSAEEKEALANYLKANRKDIISRAKKISGIMNMLGDLREPQN